MNKDLTEIAFILDRSGSMSSVAEAAITGFNEFLRDQQSGSPAGKTTAASSVEGKALIERSHKMRLESPIVDIVGTMRELEAGLHGRRKHIFRLIRAPAEHTHSFEVSTKNNSNSKIPMKTTYEQNHSHRTTDLRKGATT